jgi:single-stranded-DNA-specific exonuclease
LSGPLIRRRAAGDDSRLPANLHPVLRRVYAARGLAGPEELSLELAVLLPPAALRGIDTATELLARAVADQRRIVVAGDYDADGATATAVAVLGLRMLGATQVDYVVPNRFTMGYGLSPPLVELARAKRAELLVTVDNGISSLAGVAAAQAAGIQVLVTDHHLAGAELPAADAIVNPNQPGCVFPSKHLAGVGVMFYVLLALRAWLRAAGAYPAGAEPRLAELLDLVALGTVADVVRLDHNNRILVAQGLSRIRAARARPGVLALFEAAGREHRQATASDLGFVVGPRLNAAGRLEDMTVGIECLLAPDLAAARPLAAQLDGYNRERRELEAQMRDEALALVEGSEAAGVCVYDAAWHEGVVGLVASRVKDKLHRPTFAFAPAGEPGLLKGSGRSIPGLHLRDALAAVDALHPGLIPRFGGHAMAAGLSLRENQYEVFAAAFDAYCRDHLDAEALHQRLETDGELGSGELCLQTAQVLEQGGPWGQGFPEPRFEGRFQIRELRRLGSEGRHIKYKLRAPSGAEIEAIDFNGGARVVAAGGEAALVYRLVINRFRGTEAVELQVEHLQA